MHEKILILGSGGHSLTIQESLVRKGISPDCIGIVDAVNCMVSPFGIKKIGCDEDLPTLFQQDWQIAVIGVGSVLDTTKRHHLASLLQTIGFSLLTIVDPSAEISSCATLKNGIFVAKRAVIQPAAVIEDMAIINTGAILEHGCHVGAFSHISSGTTLLGNVCVGKDTLVGGGSVIREGIRVGNHCIVGAGSVVVHDLPDNCVAYGNPCTVRRVNQ